jgi:hypothetical protein
MTLSTVLTFARAQAQTDSNGLTDAKGIIFANEALQDFHRRLVNSGVDASQLQEAYRDGTVGTGTYLYPTDMLFLKAIELNYANASAQDYQTAAQVDVSNLPNGSFSWLRVNGDPYTPQFDDRGDWYEIFPTPTSAHNVSQLIRIFYYLKPTEYTSTSDTVSYPESLDTALLGWRIAASYLYSLGDANKLAQGDAFNRKYEERIQQYIGTLARGVQQPIQATPLQIDGWQF